MSFFQIRIGHVVLTTPTMTGGATNPRWNKTFQWYVTSEMGIVEKKIREPISIPDFVSHTNSILPPGVEAFDVEIYDERVLMSDALIAQATIAIPEQVLNGDTKEDWWPLSGQQGEGKCVLRISLRIFRRSQKQTIYETERALSS